MIFRIVLIISIILLVFFTIFLSVYVHKTKAGGEHLSRIQLYVTFVGILITLASSILSMKGILNTNDDIKINKDNDFAINISDEPKEEFNLKDDYNDENTETENSQTQLDVKSSPIKGGNNESERNFAIQKIAQYESNKDFEGGIQYINSISSPLRNDSEIVNKLNYFKSTYREQVLRDAEDIFHSAGYTEAIKVLNNATTILPDDGAIKSKIEYYQSYGPMPIKSIVMKSASSHYNFSANERDPRGKMYTNVVYLYSSAINGIGYNGKLELYTERKYSTFTCTLVPESNYSTNSGAGAYIEIYKDGILAYTSDLITYKTTGIDVNLDIRYTEYLQIKIINVNSSYPYMAHADTLLCDAYVSK